MPTTLQLRPLDWLRPDPKNPRSHPPGQIGKIAESIRAFGFNNPILADPAGVIIAGEARLAAARQLGLATAPVLVLDHLTETQRRAYAVADNRIALDAGWNEALLAQVLAEVEASNIDLGVVGFDPAEIDALLGTVAGIEFPALPTGDRAPFQQITFTLHDAQVAVVKEALAAAKARGPFTDTPNENSNGNALARVCAAYLEGARVG